MEQMEPISGNRVERRRKSHGVNSHSSKPYERDSKSRRKTFDENDDSSLLGGIKSFLKKFTYTPTKPVQRIHEVELHSEEDTKSEDDKQLVPVDTNADKEQTLYPKVRNSVVTIVCRVFE
jgi:hypothetical protein